MRGVTVRAPSRARPLLTRVLAQDPDLQQHLPDREKAAATRASLCGIEDIEVGPWPADDHVYDELGLGLLITHGLLERHIILAGRASIELLGPGDLIRPWQDDDGYATVPISAGWRASHPTRVAVLDQEFIQRMSRWPSVLGELSGRAVRRSRALGLLNALAGVTGVHLRLELLLWHLADRWGMVGPDGVVMPLRLSHSTLGTMIGAQRETVTRSFKILVAQGVVSRRGQGWVLHGNPPTEAGKP